MTERAHTFFVGNKPKIHFYNGEEGLAFSDVYLYPGYSDIRSRHSGEINTKTRIANGVPELSIPFISAGMDTVTEDAMAITMALHGGLGEIHRNNTPKEQADLVRRVKDKMRVIEEFPPIVGEKATVKDALDLLKKRARGYVIVHPGNDYDGLILGMATMKDFAAGKPDTPIVDVMTPLYPQKEWKRHDHVLVTAQQGTTLEEAVTIMRDYRIEKLPVLAPDGKLVGVYTLKDSQCITGHPNASLDNKGRLLVGAAIGVHEMDVDRAHRLVDAGVDVLFIDIAHGHHIYTEEMMTRLKIQENIQTPIIVGNVATREGVLFAYSLGADGIKVGIGPGFVCRTRNVAGTGIPQITAILEAKEALGTIFSDSPPIIADGGIREEGDVPKAIAAGADTVMMGSVIAGTDKSPGDLVPVNGSLHKRVRGMASQKVYEDRAKMGDSTTDPSLYTPEGRETFVPYQGATEQVLFRFLGGLRSGMSYVGAHTIEEMQNAELIHVSSHGANEQGRQLG